MNLIPTVIEKEGQNERAYDIFSRMLKDRIVMVNGVVDEHMSVTVVAQLLFLESQSPEDDIFMYINSPGGSVTAGMAIIDTMNWIKPEINTIVMGQAASMGSLIATSGTFGKRLMLPNARHLIHQPLGGFSGQTTDAEIHVKELARWKTILTEIYRKQTNQPLSRLKPDMERDNFMDADESIAYGLVDRIEYERQ